MQSSCSVIRLVTLHISQKIVLTLSYSFIKRKKKKTWKFIFNFGKVWQKKSQPNVRFKAFFHQCERWWRPWEVDESIPTDKERLRPILIFERFKVINFTNIPSADAQFLWFCGLPLFWALEEPLVSSLISAAADKVSPRVYIDICYKLISKVSKRTLSWVFSLVFGLKCFIFGTKHHPMKKKRKLIKNELNFRGRCSRS